MEELGGASEKWCGSLVLARPLPAEHLEPGAGDREELAVIDTAAKADGARRVIQVTERSETQLQAVHDGSAGVVRPFGVISVSELRSLRGGWAPRCGCRCAGARLRAGARVARHER